MAMYGSNLWCYVIFVFRANFSKAIIFSFVEDIHLPENYKLKVVEEIYQEQCVYENQYTQGIRKENGIHFEQQIIILQTFFFFICFCFFGGRGSSLGRFCSRRTPIGSLCVYASFRLSTL